MPNIIDIQEFEESFVIYLGSDSNSVSAYTLASTLISFADAAKVANDFINPGYNIEIQVIALEDGSFKAKIKAVFEDAKNLFSKETLKIVVLAVIAAYIYEHTLAPDKNVNVLVSDDLVKIEQGDKIIVVPKEVHNHLNQIKESEKFQREIGNVFSTLEKDRTINSFGIQKNIKDSEPTAVIPRSKFSELSALASETINEEERAITQVEQLQIIRAILEKGSRKWQFSWKGIRISAPVFDDKFYQEFYDHRIKIAPGDSLKVKLKIYQKRNKAAGIYENTRYEIIEVIEHTPRSSQINLDTNN